MNTKCSLYVCTFKQKNMFKDVVSNSKTKAFKYVTFCRSKYKKI